MRQPTPMERAFLRGLLMKSSRHNNGKLYAYPSWHPEDRFYTEWDWELRQHRQVKRLVDEGYIRFVHHNSDDTYIEILREEAV
jgi:hypothetical protein